MQEIIVSLKYVIDGNLFWQSMGFTTAIAIFIGAILFHESNRTTFQKALFTVLIYSFFLIFTSVARVSPHVMQGIVDQKTYASSLTVVLITLAYILGLIIGFFILRKRSTHGIRQLHRKI